MSWEEDGGSERAFCIRKSEDERGRFMVACRDIREGETVLCEGPLVVGPKKVKRHLHQQQPRCLGCCRELSRSQLCPKGCGLPMCGDTCDYLHLHLPECKLLREFGASAQKLLQEQQQDGDGSLDVEDWLLPLRCLALQVQQPDQWEKFSALQAHLEERRNDPIWKIDRHYVWEPLQEMLGTSCPELVDEEKVHWVCGVLDINSYEVMVGPSMVFRGVFPTASLINHDCCANVRHFFSWDLTMHVKATRPIPKGFEIKANYTQVLWGTMARRRHLQLAKYFSCACDRCKDHTENGTYLGAMRCPRCSEIMTAMKPLQDESVWRCKSCDQRLTAEQATFIQITLGKVLQKVNHSEPTSIEKFLAKYQKLIPPCNHVFVEMKYALVQLYGNLRGFSFPELHDELLERKRSLCAELLKILQKLRTGSCRARGLLLYEMHATLMEMVRRLQDKGDKAELTLKILKQEAYSALKEAGYILEGDSTTPHDLQRKLKSMAESLTEK